MARKRKSPSRVRRAITAAIPWAVFAALIGIPILLDVWQLSVYPAVIGGLVLFWMYLEHRAKTDPDHPLGFLDHKHAMQFGFLFGMPALLFLAVWTFGLTFSGHPVLKKAGLIILALVIIAVVCAEPIGKLGDALFAEKRSKGRRVRRKW
jgi:small-conductance mechanosensitive channel